MTDTCFLWGVEDCFEGYDGYVVPSLPIVQLSNGFLAAPLEAGWSVATWDRLRGPTHPAELQNRVTRFDLKSPVVVPEGSALLFAGPQYQLACRELGCELGVLRVEIQSGFLVGLCPSEEGDNLRQKHADAACRIFDEEVSQYLKERGGPTSSRLLAACTLLVGNSLVTEQARFVREILLAQYGESQDRLARLIYSASVQLGKSLDEVMTMAATYTSDLG